MEHQGMRYNISITFLLLTTTLVQAQQPGSLDLSFNPTDQGLGLGDGAYGGPVEEVVRQPDGKVLLCGWFSKYNGVLTNKVARLNVDGTLDDTFSSWPGASGTVNAIALQPDGKVLIGGIFTTYNGIPRRSIARLNENGSLDTTFDPGTGLSTGTSGSPDVEAISLQPDGRIVIAGYFESYNGVARNNIARLNTDGSIDMSFDPGTGPTGRVFAVHVSASGKMQVGGEFTSFNGSAHGSLVRLNMNGSIDPSFNTGSGFQGQVACIVERSDGTLYIGGRFSTYNNIPRKCTALLLADGSLDPTYDSSIGPDPSGNLYNVRSIAEQADGKLLVGGHFTTFNGAPQAHIMRLSETGALDPTYQIGIGPDRPVFGIRLLPDGKALVCGEFSAYDDRSAFGLTVLNSDGSLDTSFNPGMGFNNDVVVQILLQADQRIIVRGSFQGYNGVTRRGIARLLPGGELDSTFDPGLAASGGTLNGMALQPDGKVVVGGAFTQFNGVPRNRIARLNTDGSVDAGFDPGSGLDNWVFAVAVQPDGKVLVGGNFTTANGVARNRIARFNTNGSLDNSFDPGSGADLAVRSFTVIDDGRILITGQFTTIDGVPRNRIARLLSDGSLDTTFDPGTGADGVVQRSIALPNGKALIQGGFFNYDGEPRQGLARINEDGSHDLGFNAGYSTSTSPQDLAVRSDGRILVVGAVTMAIDGTPRRGVARLFPNGELDLSFDPGEGSDNSIVTLALLSDERILVGGFFVQYGATGRNRIARIHDGTVPFVSIRPRVYLDGPFNGTSLMNDDLRAQQLIPLTEPYTSIGYVHTDGGGEAIPASLLGTAGANACVDWVVIELRDPIQPTTVLASQSALLQRDGDVVATDGLSPLVFLLAEGHYQVAVRHRNHLGAMTSTPLDLTGQPTDMDLTTGALGTWGNDATKEVGSNRTLWAGDANFDRQVKYVGQDNDRDEVLIEIGGIDPTNVVSDVYLGTDVNMDGQVKYVGSDNDRDVILQTIGGVPTAVRLEQLP